jgi:phosphate transport system protein
MPHIVASFDAELQKLSALVVDMGATVATQIEDAARAFQSRDMALAKSVIATDKMVDSLQMRIEERVISMIAKRQPMAIDLRETITTLKIATDLERMGDLAKNNAKRVIAMNEHAHPTGVGVNLDILSKSAHEQLARVMQAYARRNKDLARQVWESDGEIDTLHTALFRELLTYMMEDPRSIGYCAHLLFCAKNLERIGDHATTTLQPASSSRASGQRGRTPAQSSPTRWTTDISNHAQAFGSNGPPGEHGLRRGCNCAVTSVCHVIRCRTRNANCRRDVEATPDVGFACTVFRQQHAGRRSHGRGRQCPLGAHGQEASSHGSNRYPAEGSRSWLRPLKGWPLSHA